MTENEINQLPDYIKESTETYIKRRKYAILHPEYNLTDCDYTDYQSDINVAEVEEMISSDTAWRLRNEVLNGEY